MQSAMIQNKKLITTGHTFDIGAAILVDGEKQKKTANDDQDPESILIAKKAGGQIAWTIRDLTSAKHRWQSVCAVLVYAPVISRAQTGKLVEGRRTAQ